MLEATIAIPCYQQAEYIGQALASCAAQTVQPAEVIVIDDGSDAAQSASIKAQSESYGASYYRVANRGLPNARNAALMLCGTYAFLPLDADDWIEPSYLEKTLPMLAGGFDVVLTGLQEHGPTRNGCYMPGYDRPYDQVTIDLLVNSYNRFFYCSLFRTQILREVGGYNGRLAGWPGLVKGGYEDWALWIDLLKRGARFTGINEPLFNYRTRPDSMLAEAESNRELLVQEIRRHHEY